MNKPRLYKEKNPNSMGLKTLHYSKFGLVGVGIGVGFGFDAGAGD
jgi:hypothetical protein